MRFLILAAAALAAVPVLAPAPAMASEGAMGQLSDPAFQQRTAGMLAVMLEAMLDMDMAPMLDAVAEIDGRDTLHPDAGTTVRDLAGPDAERMPQQVAEKLPVMMGAMAGMAEQMEAILPVLREAAERLPRDLH